MPAIAGILKGLTIEYDAVAAGGEFLTESQVAGAKVVELDLTTKHTKYTKRNDQAHPTAAEKD